MKGRGEERGEGGERGGERGEEREEKEWYPIFLLLDRKYQKSGVCGRAVVQRDCSGREDQGDGEGEGSTPSRSPTSGRGGGEEEEEVRRSVGGKDGKLLLFCFALQQL